MNLLISIMPCFIVPKLKGRRKRGQLIEPIWTQLQNRAKRWNCYSTFWGLFSTLSISYLFETLNLKNTHTQKQNVHIYTNTCSNSHNIQLTIVEEVGGMRMKRNEMGLLKCMTGSKWWLLRYKVFWQCIPSLWIWESVDNKQIQHDRLYVSVHIMLCF